MLLIENAPETTDGPKHDSLHFTFFDATDVAAKLVSPPNWTCLTAETEVKHGWNLNFGV